MDLWDDEKLIDWALDQNSDSAFESLMRRYYAMAYALAYQWTASKEHAEDLTQEIFLKLARKLTQFKKRSSFKTWFYRLAINTAKDYRKKRLREDSRQKEFDESHWAVQPESDLEQSNELLEKIHELPQAIAQALLLVYVDGKNHAEAAHILNCAESTVSWRVHEGKKKLKSLMGV